MDTLQEAAKALEQVTGQHEGTHLHDQPQNIEDPLSKLMLASTIGALADAAIDLEQWDTALYLIKQAIDIIPHEPLPQLKLAQTLVLRAEAQCTCQSLEVVNHCPGAVALAKHTRQAFEQAIDAADQHINHFIGMLEASQRKDGHDEVNTSSNERLPTQVARVEVARWRARGEAVFNPGPQSAKALSATISLLHPTPEDIAAQIAVFTQIEQGSEQGIPGSNGLNNTHDEGNLRASPLTMAIRAAQTYAQHPGVLMQLSLAFLARPQSQMDALEVAVKAANYIAPNPMMAQEKQDVDSARQTDAPDHPISQHRQNQQALSHYLIARTAHAADKPDIALPAIQAALQNWPDEPRWQARAADIYRLMGDNSSAIPHLSEAARLEPDYAPAHLALGQAYLSLSKRNSGLAGEAVRALERACDLDPEQPSSWMSLADAYRLAGDLNKASSCAERAIALAPDQVPPLLLRAEIALQAGNPQEAHAQVLAALHLQELHQAPLANHSIEDPSLVLLLARTLDQLDRHDEAISALELALPQAHDPLPLLLERVELLKRSKGADNAMQALQEIASEYPDEPSVLYHLAFAHQETGNNEAAVRSAQRALQLALPSESGEHQPPRLSVDDKTALHYLLGREFRLSGQLDQSVHHLNESIRLSPNLLEAYLELGGALQDRRELDQALQVYQQAIQVTPNDPRPYFQAGMALKECKDYQSAETMLRRAVALAPNELSIHRQLGAVVALNLVHNRRKANVET
jgi:tetratricopeptide (TPR) repeat protein